MAAMAETAATGGGAEPVIIKKYANRRLYNTARSSYVTLDHLAGMVRDGQDFVVRDAKTGEDITRAVLTQIIFEEETKGASMLPTNFLRKIISLYGDSLQSVVPGYLEASMDAFARNQEQMRESVTRLFGAAPGMENFEALTRRNMEMFKDAMRMFTPFAGADTERRGAKGQPAQDELSELKSQLKQMQTQLDRISGKS